MSDAEIPNAWEELLSLLYPEEKIEFIVLGDWVGVIHIHRSDPGYVPNDKKNILLDPGDAEPLMKGWSLRPFSPQGTLSYAIQVWTDRRILRSHLLGHTSPYQAILSMPREPKSFHCTFTIPMHFGIYPIPSDCT